MDTSLRKATRLRLATAWQAARQANEHEMVLLSLCQSWGSRLQLSWGGSTVLVAAMIARMQQANIWLSARILDCGWSTGEGQAFLTNVSVEALNR
jgi:hypothetical protein